MYDVFISYSRKDTQVIDRIEKEFQKYGIKMFIDRAGIDAGTDWAETIAQALYDSEVILFVWSENSNTSENTANEIALAIDYQKTIVPFKIGEFKADFKLSYRLIRFNRIDALPYNEGKVVELGQKMAKLLGKHKLSDPVAAPQEDAPQKDTPKTPQVDPKLELLYSTGREALLAFRLEDAVKDLAQPAIQDYKDARLLLSYIVSKGSRISHVSKETFKPFYDAAEQENSYALYVLSCVAGFIELDRDLQFSYAKLCADMGDSYGMYMVSECYDRGQGVKKDIREGDIYRQQAVQKDNVLATILHARNLIFGWTIKKNPKKGFSILQMLADKKIPEAIYRLAYSYESGIGVEKDRKKAEELYLESLKYGYMESYDHLASLFIYDEKGNITENEEDKRKGYDYLMKGSRINETACLASLASGYYLGSFVKQDYQQAMRWYKKAAQYADSLAFYMIAYMYYYGNGVDENNEEAWNWTQEGIRHASANCIYMAGMICKEGFAPEGHKPEESLKYYEEVADLGGWAAEQALHDMYEIYRPDWYNMYQLREYKQYEWVEENEEKAVAAIRRAAEYDNIDAKYLYGIILTDTERPDADEFHGVDLLESVADSQPLAYIRLALLSLEGIGKPFSQEYSMQLCDKAKEAGVDEKLIDYVLAKTKIQVLGDAELTAENKKDFDDILNQLKPCIEAKMPEAYMPYTQTLITLVSDGSTGNVPTTDGGTPNIIRDNSTPGMYGVIKTSGSVVKVRNTNTDSSYSDMFFRVASDYAELGYMQAIADLGLCYYVGVGVQEDKERALEYYNKAADLGSDVSAFHAGVIYFEKNDKQQAKYRLRQALELGYDQQKVQEYLDKLA